jgi:hypothetical protein
MKELNDMGHLGVKDTKLIPTDSFKRQPINYTSTSSSPYKKKRVDYKFPNSQALNTSLDSSHANYGSPE